MNEIRDLIVGIDFGKEYSQICYYDRKGDEARSLSMKAGGNQYEAPCILCWRPEQKDYCVGLEADYFVREKGGVMIDDVYGICEKSDSVLVEGQELAPWEILAQFLQGMLKFLGVAELVKNTKCVAVTLPGLTEIQVENFQKAFEIIGFPHEKYMLLDYGESFYYYVLSQKRETWNRSVGWYAFTPENVSFRKMTMNGATKPVTVKLEEAVETELPAEGQERDSEFGKFVQKTLGRDLFSSIQITGDGFSQDWAEQSVRLLCYQKRKVFYGNNLFAKGACAAGKEKTENNRKAGEKMTFEIENVYPEVVLPDYETVIKNVIEAALDYEKCPYEAQVYVLLTDNEEIHQINREHRQIDRPTDVPMADYPVPGDFSDIEERDPDAFHPETGELILGDIIISMDKVKEQAKAYGHSNTRELAFLVAHSMLHLSGYDHVEDEERIQMEDMQREILERRGYRR